MSPDDSGSADDRDESGTADPADDRDVLVELPEELRVELKEPLGPIFTDAQRLLSEVDGPLVAVGDVVTYHLHAAGATPDVAVVDGLTKREAVDERVADAVSAVGERAREVRVENPAATLTRGMVTALGDALTDSEPTVIVVDGEEDLVALPAVVAAPLGASVVYGQPDEGMVHARVTDETKAATRDLLTRMDGDPDALLEILE